MPRKWVIMEVEDTTGQSVFRDFLRRYSPVDTINQEYMWLRPDRIMRGAWRLGKPDKGDNILVVSDDRSLALYEVKSEDLGGHYIILDPPVVEVPKMPDWERRMRQAHQTTMAPDNINLLIKAMKDARMGWGKKAK